MLEVEKEIPGGRKKHSVLKKLQAVYSGWLAHGNEGVRWRILGVRKRNFTSIWMYMHAYMHGCVYVCMCESKCHNMILSHTISNALYFLLKGVGQFLLT